MPSAVDTVTFQNKKTKTTLTGDATLADDSGLSGGFSEVAEGFPTSSSNIGSTETVTETVSGISITSTINKLIINAITQYSTDNAPVTIRIRETNLTGAILASFVVNTANNTGGNFHVIVVPFSAILDNISTSVTTFVLTRQGSNTLNLRTLGERLDIDVINLTDTHAASSKNTNIING